VTINLARPAISAQAVRKSFGEHLVLDGVDLTVAEGTIFSLLGPNGAGKTTLVEMLEGLSRPDAGSVRVLGLDPRRRQRAVRARIGVVLQNHGIDPRIRVGEVAAQFAAYYRRRGDGAAVVRARAAATLERFGLDGRRRSLVGTLSGGERRRLDLALAMIGEPEVVFLDEPTANLDVLGRRAVWSAIEDLVSSGRAVVMTTHHFDEAEMLSDRVVLMVGGRILADGPPAALETGRERVLRARYTVSPPVPPAPWVLEGRDLVFTCRDPLASLRELVAWTEAMGLEMQSLSIDAAPLEDVCLRLFAGEAS
jgi:ABC-2 type transport system ATP-binding protein